MKLRIKYILTFLLLMLIPVSLLAAPVAKGKEKDKFTVVIDAGHGGKDVGAMDNGIREKDVNLGVALQLSELIKKKLKDVKVVLTRDNDTYLTLQERADKANNAKGDLFISIHTNSVDRSNKNRTTVAGSSVYALGLHKDANNMAVARRENAVIELESNHEHKYSGFDPNKDESYIIFEMAQKKNLEKSIKFANEAQKQLVGVAGRKDRGVHQAGFWVLWATSMPAVLVELDFICNPTSAQYIDSEEGQKKMAEALFNAVKSYSTSFINSKGHAYEESNSDEILETLLASSGTENTGEAMATPVRKREVTSVPADAPCVSKGKSASRKRRSASAKAKSEARDYETAMIPLHEPQKPEETVIASANDTPAPASDTNSKDKKKKKNNKKNENQNKEKEGGKVKASFAKATVKADNAHAAARRSTRASANAKATNMKTVYKIQLLSSVDELNDRSPKFCGLAPVSSFRENNLYKYTYGESENKTEIEALLKEVKELIPDAFVIQVTKIDKKS